MSFDGVFGRLGWTCRGVRFNGKAVRVPRDCKKTRRPRKTKAVFRDSITRQLAGPNDRHRFGRFAC